MALLEKGNWNPGQNDPWMCNLSIHIPPGRTETLEPSPATIQPPMMASSQSPGLCLNRQVILLSFHLKALLCPDLYPCQPPYGPSYNSLRCKGSSTKNEPLSKSGTVHCGICQEWEPGIESITRSVHNAQNDSPLLGIRTADFVGPRH